MQCDKWSEKWTAFWNQDGPSQWLPHTEQLASGRSFACGGGVQDWLVFDFKFFIASLDLEGNLDDPWATIVDKTSKLPKLFQELSSPLETQGKGRKLIRMREQVGL